MHASSGSVHGRADSSTSCYTDHHPLLGCVVFCRGGRGAVSDYLSCDLHVCFGLLLLVLLLVRRMPRVHPPIVHLGGAGGFMDVCGCFWAGSVLPWGCSTCLPLVWPSTIVVTCFCLLFDLPVACSLLWFLVIASCLSLWVSTLYIGYYYTHILQERHKRSIPSILHIIYT